MGEGGGRRQAAADADHDNLAALLKTAGFRAADRKALHQAVLQGHLTPADILAELSRAYADPDVRRPALAAAATLLRGDMPPPEFRDPETWKRYLPPPLVTLAVQQGLISPEPEPGPENAVSLPGDAPPDMGAETWVPEPHPPDMGPLPPQARRWWELVKGQLAAEMPRASYESWLAPAIPWAYSNGGEEGRLTVAVANEFAKQWLENRLERILEQKLSGIAGKPVRVQFVVEAV